MFLYCNGECGNDLLDAEVGCQKPDADAYCKLKLCSGNAYATSYVVSKPTSNSDPAKTDEPAFGCSDPRVAKSKGTFEGEWFGMPVYYVEDVYTTYGWGDVVAEIKCLTAGTYNHYF